MFVTPGAEELAIVRKIFAEKHFQTMIRKQERLQGKPVADPFVIARAKFLGEACVVTSEKPTPNAAKIPNVCEKFDVEWTDLEGFMERERWRFQDVSTRSYLENRIVHIIIYSVIHSIPGEEIRSRFARRGRTARKNESVE